mgnify:FL=1
MSAADLTIDALVRDGMIDLYADPLLGERCDDARDAWIAAVEADPDADLDVWIAEAAPWMERPRHGAVGVPTGDAFVWVGVLR